MCASVTTPWTSTVQGNSEIHGVGMHVEGETAVFNRGARLTGEIGAHGRS